MKTRRIDKPKSLARDSGISLTAFGIGLLFSVIACVVISGAELVVHNVPIGGLQLPPAALGLLVILIAINQITRRISRLLTLSPQDLLTVYCMTVFASMISSRGLLQRLIPFLVTPAYYADQSNNWAQLYFPYIKEWLVPFYPNPKQVSAPLIATRFFEGLKSGESIEWHQWIGPMVIWGVLALLIFGAFMFLAAILRRQWVEHERLTFPLAQLPLEMVRTSGTDVPLFRNKLTYLGFLIPAVVFTINGLSNMYPSIPEISLSLRLDKMITTAPWNAIGYTVIYLSFAAIGFLFLLPTEITFSLWFFFLLMRLQQVVAAAYGMESPGMRMYPTNVFIGYQVMGAYFVLVGYMVYVSLPHLKRVVKAALDMEKVDDSNELIPYKVAVMGLILCFLGAALWLVMAGMSAWLALLVLFVFIFVIALVMARSTAETGLLMTESSFRPLDVYRLFAPVTNLGPSNLTVLMMMDTVFFVELRSLVFTGFLDALKIGDSARIRLRSFLPVFVGSILIAMVVGGAFQIWMPYHYGANNMYWYSYTFSNRLGLFDYEPAMRGPVDYVGWQAPVFLLVGIAVTAFLSYMRLTFFWWPLHPIGYALCCSWTILVFWFPCVVAWLCKSLVMKYGGMRLYRTLRPLALGMIMSEFTMAVIWSIIAWQTGIRAPAFPWP